MQTIFLRLVFLITCFIMSLSMYAQITFHHEKVNPTIDSLRQIRQNVEADEKAKLKSAIEALQERLKEDKISVHEFESEKKILAEKHAQNIKSRTLILDESIEYLKRNDDKSVNRLSLGIGIGGKEDKVKEIDSVTYYPTITTSGVFIAFGFSNTISDDHSLNDTPYKMAGSKFFEFGYNWRTAFKEYSCLHLRYGVGFHIDGYKPSDNQYFVMEDKRLNLEEHAIELNKSKLRATNIIVPIYLEYMKPKYTVRRSGKKVYSYEDSWKFGIGGYAGLNIKTTQILKYKEDGRRIRSKENMSSGINQAVYGLNAYVGIGGVSLYARYALSDLFKDGLYKENTVVFGLRISTDA